VSTVSPVQHCEALTRYFSLEALLLNRIPVVLSCRKEGKGSTVNKDLRKLIKELEAQGFTVEVGKKNPHPVVRKNGVRVATLASTPSDARSWKNGIAALRRAGFNWPH